MTVDPVQQPVAGERLVVLRDLGTGFTPPSRVEELLLTLRWQETGDPDDLVTHPAALGGGVALQAPRRVTDTVRPTQTYPEEGDWAAATGRGPPV